MSSPIYIKIHNQLRENIEDGKWKVGERIPAERELANQFSVSRMTLRQAIQELVDEGILERRVGSGTFVANRKVQERMSGVTSFTGVALTTLFIAIDKYPLCSIRPIANIIISIEPIAFISIKLFIAVPIM